MVCAHHRIIITVSIEVFVGEGFWRCGYCAAVIRIYKPTNCRVIISCSRYVEVKVNIVVITSVEEGACLEAMLESCVGERQRYLASLWLS